MTFSLFGATGYWYGLIVGLSALVYLGAAGLLGFQKRLPSGTIRLFGLLGLPLSLLLARLGFCAVNYDYFTQAVSQPLKMLYFWDGGYSLLGALCGLVLAALLTARIRGQRFGKVFDVTAAPLGLLLVGIRLAEAFTDGQLGVGRQVADETLPLLLPWLFVPDQMGTLTLYRLAVFRYEMVASAVFFGLSLCLFFGKKQRRRARAGDVGMMVYALFGAIQVVFESLRDDGHMVAGFIRVQQVGYVLMPVLALAVLGARYAHIREKRKAVIGAWLLLPAAALVALLMVHPLNHVLDLTGHRTIGFILLGAMVVYMAIFLRVKGADGRLIASWLLMIAAIAGCVMVEFSVDGSDNLVRDYAMMAGFCLVLFLTPFALWRRLENRVYKEESIRVHIAR
ncbi:MAG: prolipoprotein diacylglyceryl transferase [Eubacteriales bacterium]|nr:prolipoprotein diacylglyceryl transferase [Eubacteriales bacterium]